jgi:micrococcal nuclease
MYEYSATVDRFVDGDTVDLIVDLGFKVQMKIRVRLLGFDAPEVRGPEKAEGIPLAKWCTDEWQDSTVTLQSHKTGKYGRWLGVLTDESGRNINDAIQMKMQNL